MTEVDIEVGYIFDETEKALNYEGCKTVIHKGGTGSGKTYDLILFLIYLAGKTPGIVITVVSESNPHLQIGAIRILESVLRKTGANEITHMVKNPTVWTHTNGSIIEFFSADRIDKALGARRDVLYGNEINSLKGEVWDELARRSEIVLGDFNPTAEFWLEDWIQDYEPYKIIKSNYTHNKFLPETERKRIERRVARDANFKRIHIDCEYGVYEGLIFTEWQQVDELPEGSKKYGLDFGYTNDPSVLVAVVETNDAYYIDELFYKTGLLNKDIAGLMKSNGLRQNYDEIIADSAEPKSIDEIRLTGFNVKPAVKGPDSIKNGVQKLQSKKIYVTKRSVNLIKELRNYSWVTDKDGKATNKPIDAFNHGIDAIRYAISTKLTPNWSL